MSKNTRLLSSSPYYGPDYGNQLVDDFGTIPAPSEAERHAARLYVAGAARDVEDARELLAMLNLLEDA